MPKRTVFFVTPHKPSGWAVKKSGQKSPISTHRLKMAAVKAGKRVAKRAQRGMIRIQNRNRKLEAAHSYG